MLQNNIRDELKDDLQQKVSSLLSVSRENIRQAKELSASFSSFAKESNKRMDAISHQMNDKISKTQDDVKHDGAETRELVKYEGQQIHSIMLDESEKIREIVRRDGEKTRQFIFNLMKNHVGDIKNNHFKILIEEPSLCASFSESTDENVTKANMRSNGGNRSGGNNVRAEKRGIESEISNTGNKIARTFEESMANTGGVLKGEDTIETNYDASSILTEVREISNTGNKIARIHEVPRFNISQRALIRFCCTIKQVLIFDI